MDDHLAPTSERRDRLRVLLAEDGLAEDGLDGMLITDLANIRYLSGFSGSNAALYVSASDPEDDVIATDARYTVQVGAEAADLPVILDRASIGALIAERAKAANISNVVFDRGGHIYHGKVKALAEAAREAGLQF